MQDAIEPARLGTIVLTKNDRFKIRTGKVLNYHFHGSQFFMKTIWFLVSNEKNKPTKDSKIGKTLRELGEVVPVVLSKEQLETMNSGKPHCFGFTIPKEPDFVIQLVGSEYYHKVTTGGKNESS